MMLSVDELFSIDAADQTLMISATMVVFWTDERLALKSYPDCWHNNEVMASACNESFEMRKEIDSMTDKVQSDLRTCCFFLNFKFIIICKIWIPEVEVSNIVQKTANLGLSGGANFVIMDGCSGMNTLVVSHKLEMSCPLDFTYYPFDRQVHTIIF